MQSNLFVLCLVGTFFSVQGQVTFPGRCPNVTVVQNFEAERYLGRWFEIEKYFATFEAGAMCVQANYAAQENGTIRVLNTQIQEATGEPRQIIGTARSNVTDGSAKFAVSFPSLPPQVGESPYWVLDTDYENYSLVWACTEYVALNVNLQFLWFLTREVDPSVDVRNRVHEKMDELSLKRDGILTTNHTNCPTDSMRF